MEHAENRIIKYEGCFSEFPDIIPTRAVPNGPLFGNGDIGVALGGDNSGLTFWISKNDFWYAGYAHDTCENLSGIKCIGTLDIGSEVFQNTSFFARQKIESADVEAELQNEDYHLYLSAYAPYTQSLVVIKAVAKKGNIPIRFDMRPMEDERFAVSGIQADGGHFVMTKDYVKQVEWETKSAVVGQVLGWDRMDGVLKEGEEAVLVLSIHTNHDETDYFEKAQMDIDELNQERLKQYRAAHLNWWKNFWNTSGISIPSEPAIEKFWYGSHYLMACCSKGGKFPPGLFGNWITTNQPNWNGDYHLNYNYEAPWWGVFSSNKIMLAEPYDKPLIDYISQARKNARERLGKNGIYAKVGIGPRGLESSKMFYKDGGEAVDIPFWGQKSNAAYAAVNMVMRFYSTWDKEYAKNCAFPYLCEVADFWEDYLILEDGRYVIYEDCICENSALAKGMFDWVQNDLPDYGSDFNPILSLGLLRMIFRALLDISEYLDTAANRREKWKDILLRLSEFPVMEREGKTVFRLTERGQEWCDSNSLAIQHIFPCGAVGLSSDKRLLTIAQDTVEQMNRWEDFNAFATYFTAAARVGYDSNTILGHMNKQIEKFSFDNVFIYYGGGGIECCSAVPGCINEMLFQSHEGVIRLFPVWDRWKDASFYQLRGYGAFLVSAKLQDGMVQNVRIFSEKGRQCAVLCPWKSGMIILEDGNAVAADREDAPDGIIYYFQTEAGKNYQLQEKSEI